MAKRLTAAERLDWVQNARNLCPYCRHPDGEIEATDYDWDDGCLVKVSCLNRDCGRKWAEMYSLTGLVELDDDDNIIEDREDVHWCYVCGHPYKLDENEVSNHLTEEGKIDYDQDADHVAYGNEDQNVTQEGKAKEEDPA